MQTLLRPNKLASLSLEKRKLLERYCRRLYLDIESRRIGGKVNGVDFEPLHREFSSGFGLLTDWGGSVAYHIPIALRHAAIWTTWYCKQRSTYWLVRHESFEQPSRGERRTRAGDSPRTSFPLQQVTFRMRGLNSNCSKIQSQIQERSTRRSM